MTSAPLSVAQPVIGWPAAHAAAGAAVQAAQAMEVRANVALVDASGVLAAFLRMPGAPLHSAQPSHAPASRRWA